MLLFNWLRWHPAKPSKVVRFRHVEKSITWINRNIKIKYVPELPSPTWIVLIWEILPTGPPPERHESRHFLFRDLNFSSTQRMLLNVLHAKVQRTWVISETVLSLISSLSADRFDCVYWKLVPVTSKYHGTKEFMMYLCCLSVFSPLAIHLLPLQRKSLIEEKSKVKIAKTRPYTRQHKSRTGGQGQ